MTIEIPQNVNLTCRVDDSKFSQQLLQELKEDGEAVLAIWADREESAEQIARKIRARNNGKIE